MKTSMHHRHHKHHKQHIAARFDAAAPHYDAASPLQREAAGRLAQRVLALPLPPRPRILEIGCGTGHLTRQLLPQLGGDWVISDIAPGMVGACRRQFGTAAGYAVVDAEHPAFAPASFDLIVSSLAAQWFADLPGTLAALGRLLAPGGQLALATLGADTFAEWRAAHAALGLQAATPDYPSAAALAQVVPENLRAAIDEECIAAPLGSPLDFIRGLRAIGADTPRPGTAPLSPGQLRRVLRQLDVAATPGITYHLLYLLATQTCG